MIDDIINSVIDGVNDSVSEYMSNQDPSMIDENLNNVIDAIQEGASKMTQLTFGSIDSIIDGSSSDNLDLTHLFGGDGTESMASGAIDHSISFTGALSAGDEAFQDFKSILSKHNLSIPYGQTPSMYDGTITSLEESNLRNWIRQLFSSGKISAAEETQLFNHLRTMRNGFK